MRPKVYILIVLALYTSFARPERARTAGRLIQSIGNRLGNPISQSQLSQNWGQKKNYYIANPDPKINFKGSKNIDSSGGSDGNSGKPNVDIDGVNPAGLKSGDLNPNLKLGNNSGSSNSNLNTNKGPGDEQGSDQGGQKPNGGGQNLDISSDGQSFGLWWPVCVFVDGPDANGQIKKLVDMSAACGVNLQPYVKKVSLPSPDDPDSVNQLQRASCNLVEAGIAGKGSTLVVTNRSKILADKMCGTYDPKKNDTGTAGCNELAKTASAESKKLYQSSENVSAASGDIAAGVVDLEGYTSGAVYSHETMGHGQMGLPNGKGSGNGIQDPADKDDKGGGEEHVDSGAYTVPGCGYMRSAAIQDPNHNHKYYASKKNYYNDSGQIFQIGEKIWKTFKDGPQNNGLIVKKSFGTPDVGSDPGFSSDRNSGATSSGAHPKNNIASGPGPRGSSVRKGSEIAVKSGSVPGTRKGARGNDDTVPGQLPSRDEAVQDDGSSLTMSLNKGSAFGKSGTVGGAEGGIGDGGSGVGTSGDGSVDGVSSLASKGSEDSGSGGAGLATLRGSSSKETDLNGPDGSDFFKENKVFANESSRSARGNIRKSGDVTETNSSVVQRTPTSADPNFPLDQTKPSKKTPIDNSYVSSPRRNSLGEKGNKNRNQLSFENNM